MSKPRLSEFDENGHLRHETRGATFSPKNTSHDFAYVMDEETLEECVDVKTGEIVDPNSIDPETGKTFRQLAIERKPRTSCMSVDPTTAAKQMEANRILRNILNREKSSPKPIFNTPDEMALLLDTFFEKCFEFQIYPTKRGIALALGTDYKTLRDWENGIRGEQYRSVLKRAGEVLAEFDESVAVSGNINPILYIFRSKNYHGMRDVQDVVITPNNPLGETQDAASLQQKYLSQMKGVDPATVPKSTLETTPPEPPDSDDY